MTFHCAAWSELIDPAGVLVPIAGVPDQSLSVNGDDVRVPAEYNNIVGIAASVADGTVDPRAQLQAPSLRGKWFPDIAPISEAANWGVPPPITLFPGSPIPLAVNEDLQFHFLSNPAAAVEHEGIVLLSRGPITPVTGLIIPLRVTAGIAQAANVWTAGVLTMGQNLPVGRYSVVGMRCLAATGAWARLRFIGSAWLPGCPVNSTVAGVGHASFRRGVLGKWNTFHTTQPPQLEVLSGTATAQDLILDLMVERLGPE